MPSRRDFSFNNYGPLPFQDSAIVFPFGRRSFLPAMVERFHGERIDMGDNTDREAFTLKTGEKPITLIYSGMGSPVTANALEKAKANGVRRVVVLGACGGIAEKVRVGDIVIPTGAVRGEGTSRYYMDPSYPAIANLELAGRLLAIACERSKATVHAGVVYTTDASYRQGPEVYEQPRGTILAADCECSAAFVVGSALGLKAAAIFFCTDNIRSKEPGNRRRQGLENDTVREAFYVAADIAVGALSCD